MTEKGLRFGMSERFEIFPQNVAKDGTLIIIQKGLKLYNISDVRDLLNELHEENKQLQHDATILIQSNQDYRKENERLKQAYTQLKHRHSLLYDVCIDAECDRDSYRKDIASWVNDYIQDHTIKVDKLPVYGDDKLIYQLPNKLEYIYFKKKWECIGEVEE